ncbi:hypothetical protein [Comamonas sp.]|uniref:hypothetical protein n=1 Tax=Comamonas sp. TaxID=34028 RepID=UPI0012C7D471|nr:hypothetical protein [Comamonas sp.]MPS92888.1 hypothetical protein [Comamonas sp.]
MVNSAFDFAKNNETVRKIRSDHRFYMVDGLTSIVSHGDTDDFERVFLLAAQTESHAKVWVELNYLITTPCESYTELLEAIKEHTVNEDEIDYIGSNFVGCVDVGDYKYRSIQRITEITKQAAMQMLKLGNYYESNMLSTAFK